MSYENHGTEGFNVSPVCFGNSKMPVRGPLRTLSKPYVAFLGGTETFGKFVQRPFASVLEDDVDQDCVNLGCMNAGVDAFMNDPYIMNIAANAEISVIQVMGAQNLSNRFYRVHSRRNDRFLTASNRLQAIYPDMDFSQFSFTKHLLGALMKEDATKFEFVQRELETAWMCRMKTLVYRVPRRPLLLWLRYADTVSDDLAGVLGPRPSLVTERMVNVLRKDVADVIEVEVHTAADAGELHSMAFPNLQIAVAEQMLGPVMHAKIARALHEKLLQL